MRRSAGGSNGHRERLNGNSNGNGSSRMVNGHRRERKIRKKKVQKSAFESHYGPEWESYLQMCLLMTLLFLAGLYAFWKLIGGGDPLPSINSLFGPRRIYDIPGSMSKIGDKSVQYQLLRQEYDQIYPIDKDRTLEAVKKLRKRDYHPIPPPEEEYYDVHNCPFDPPDGYPYAWNIIEVLDHWPPDDPNPPDNVHQGICVFDYKMDQAKVMHYRDQELPFVVRGDPEVAATAERWNDPEYMAKLMNTVPHRTEYSPNNHFMYWMKPNLPTGTLAKKPNHKVHRFGYHVEAPVNWTQPTEMMRMAYDEWLSHANVSDEELGPSKPHWYYRLIGCGEQGKCDMGSSEYLYDELTFFQPRPQLYLVEHQKQKGIHCRFGMKGVIAENHFDGSRNTIVVLGGERRYILSHPEQCELLQLFPKEHPSARHSAVDWSNPDLETFPDFAHAKTNEIVMQAGDVLYLPTNWFHYIISLTLNFQCNTRSGIGPEYMPPITKCGF